MGGSTTARRACAPSSTRRWAWKRIPHLPTATLDLRAVRDESGELTGLRVATAEESAAIAGDLHEDEAPPQQGGPLGSVEAAEDWY